MRTILQEVSGCTVTATCGINSVKEGFIHIKVLLTEIVQLLLEI